MYSTFAICRMRFLVQLYEFSALPIDLSEHLPLNFSCKRSSISSRYKSGSSASVSVEIVAWSLKCDFADRHYGDSIVSPFRWDLPTGYDILRGYYTERV